VLFSESVCGEAALCYKVAIEVTDCSIRPKPVAPLTAVFLFAHAGETVGIGQSRKTINTRSHLIKINLSNVQNPQAH
jgi:hypothetical protein